jgi:hypothetical protein
MNQSRRSLARPRAVVDFAVGVSINQDDVLLNTDPRCSSIWVSNADAMLIVVDIRETSSSLLLQLAIGVLLSAP